MVRQLIQPEWMQTLVGQNNLPGNAVELPVARMFLDLGMHPGPLLAYLMAGPKLNGKPPESAPSA